jgi:iron complex transport system substrate-binding protein
MTRAPHLPGRSSARAAAAALAAAALAAAALAVGLTACSQQAQSSADTGATRSVTTAFGDVTIPEHPERVVALSEAALDTALALDVTPVGTTARRGGDAAPAYLGEKAAGIPIVATVSEPNVEEIVKAEPDLILATAGLDKAVYDKLAKVAPTVVPAAGLTAWEDQLGTYADALGKKSELDKILADLRTRADAVKATQQAGATAVVLRWMPTGAIVMNAGLMPGQALTESGRTALPLARGLADKPHSDPLSLENLAKVDADHIFVGTFDADGRNALAAAQAQPAFARLKAAKAGAVTMVDGGVWTSSSGPIAWDTVLTDIEKAL